ncbi:uncharacterized protein [Henckelia pumila]|uniref:uncharacterized protein n=1 Tax=Henckelia pumila TaxID=405737 RepID=UPI003C6E3745
MPFSSSSSTDFHQKSFRIRHEDGTKLFNKLLSKESSKSHPSFRVYYGDVSGAVPFVWETCPGTPKHTLADKYYSNYAPPLTPPPSYNYAHHGFKKYSNTTHYSSRSKLLLYSFLRRINPKKYHSSSSSSPRSTLSSSRSSFSEYAATSTPRANTFTHRRKRFTSWDNSSFYEDQKSCGGSAIDHTSPKSCFRPAGGYPVLIVKKALLSIVGRGSHDAS